MNREGATERSISVVLVDDNALVRELLAELLTAAGFTVLQAAGRAREAASEIARLRPDVAVIDHSLSDGGGLELCRMLAEQAPSVAIVVHSSAPDAADEREAFAAGARAVVAKVINCQGLIRAITAHARSRTP